MPTSIFNSWICGLKSFLKVIFSNFSKHFGQKANMHQHISGWMEGNGYQAVTSEMVVFMKHKFKKLSSMACS
jgi:hypothetical protein